MVLICFIEICFQLLLIKAGKKYHFRYFPKKKKNKTKKYQSFPLHRLFNSIWKSRSKVQGHLKIRHIILVLLFSH